MQKRKVISIVFIWISLCCFCFGQQNSLHDDYPKQLKLDGNLELSLKETLRLYYHDKDNQLSSSTRDIGNLFAQLGYDKQAIKYYNLYQYSLPPNNPDKAEISFEKAKIHLSASSYQEAILELLQINKRFLTETDRYTYYLGLSYLFIDEYDKGFDKLKTLTYLNQTDLVAFDSIKKKLVKNNKFSPSRSRLLSVLIPGLGQAVNGQVKDGINSLVLVSGLTYFMIDLSFAISLPNAALSFGPWIFRYYVGGINNAKKAGQLKKQNKKNALIVELLQEIDKKRS